MLSQFLCHDFCHKTELKDFKEWHQGISHYGFWAIEITDPDCLAQVQHSQQVLSPYLHSNYHRQAHIKLFAAGLVADHFYKAEFLRQQLAVLTRAKIANFNLQLEHGNSFSTCPYLAISDPSNSLNTIRHILAEVNPEDSPCDYIPHITLGFYNDYYKTKDIGLVLKHLAIKKQSIKVCSLIYAEYETHNIQGPYRIVHRIHLSEK
jgi:hypothetical protein